MNLLVFLFLSQAPFIEYFHPPGIWNRVLSAILPEITLEIMDLLLMDSQDSQFTQRYNPPGHDSLDGRCEDRDCTKGYHMKFPFKKPSRVEEEDSKKEDNVTTEKVA